MGSQLKQFHGSLFTFCDDRGNAQLFIKSAIQSATVLYFFKFRRTFKSNFLEELEPDKTFYDRTNSLPENYSSVK